MLLQEGVTSASETCARLRLASEAQASRLLKHTRLIIGPTDCLAPARTFNSPTARSTRDARWRIASVGGI